MKHKRHAPWFCRLLLCGLPLLTIAVFWPVHQFNFVRGDDPYYVSENLRVQSGISVDNIVWAFKSGMYHWHPLTWISLMIDAQLFGAEPRGFHVTNVLLHLANALLLFAILVQLTGRQAASALVAALFAIHPLHVEPVAWVTGRKDLLSTLFGLLAIAFYVRYVKSKPRPKSGRWYGLSLLAFICTLMSKPMLVTLPVVLLFLDYWPLGRVPAGGPRGQDEAQFGRKQAWGLLKEKLPFFLIAALYAPVAIYAHAQSGGFAPLEAFSIRVRLMNAAVAYVKYLKMTFWPTGICAHYPHPGESLSSAAAIAAAALLVVVTVIVIWQRRSRPYLAVGWMWYLVTLLPAIGILQAGRQQMADRFVYVSLIGVFVAAVWLAADFAARCRMGPLSRPKKRSGQWSQATQTVFACLGAVLVVVLAGAARVQLSYWENTETLYQRCLDVTERNTDAHDNLGAEYFGQQRYSEALAHYQALIQIDPNDAKAHSNAGITLGFLNRRQESLDHLKRAVELDPNDPKLLVNLGRALFDAGQSEQAIRQLKKAIEVDRRYVPAYLGLTKILHDQGQIGEAIEQLEKGFVAAGGPRGQADSESHFEMGPLRDQLASMHVQQGAQLGQKGKTQDALVHFRRAVQVHPDFPVARLNLATALVDTGSLNAAERQFRAMLQKWPRDPQIHNRYGLLCLRKSDPTSAARHFRYALELDPRFVEARDNLRRAEGWDHCPVRKSARDNGPKLPHDNRINLPEFPSKNP